MVPDIASFVSAAELIAAADALLITAGAGMGVDSGLPDFRGAEGFWRAYPALGRRGLQFHQVASPRTFETDPALAWGFYGHRLDLYRRITPHAGFDILRRWGEGRFHGCGVFTSNVDGHFRRAGFDAKALAECHGSIHHLQCSQPCSDDIWPADEFVPIVDTDSCTLLNEPPRCPHCASIARPNILMFGDCGWIERRSSAQESSLNHWLDGASRIVVVELGAGTAIPSVRNFSQAALIDRGAILVRINPRESVVPRRMDISLAGPAFAMLSAIDTAMRAA